MRPFLTYLFLSLLFFSTFHTNIALSKEAALRIVRITPQGDNVPTRQNVTIQFNRPVVPIGVMDGKKAGALIEIQPALKCEWRWVNTSTLRCELSEENSLQPATSYFLKIPSTFMADGSGKLRETAEHTFVTLRPDVQQILNTLWISPQKQIVKVKFNQPVTRQSVESSLYFERTEGLKNTHYALQARLPTEKEEKEYGILKDVSWEKDQEGPVSKIWLVTSLEEFPPDSSISLRVKPGLITPLGTAKGEGQREILHLHTFPSFAFLGYRCTTNEGVHLFFAPDREEKRLCNPQHPSELVFNVPVSRADLKDKIIFSPHLNIDAEEDDFWGSENLEYLLYRNRKQAQEYSIDIPRGLQAATEIKIDDKASVGGGPETKIRDIFDRPLTNNVHLSFSTNHRKPNFEILHHHAVLESKTDSEVPLYVNNLKKTIFTYRSLTAQGAQQGLTSIQNIPEVKNIQFAIPFQIREMLGGKSGAVYGTLTTEPEVKKDQEAYGENEDEMDGPGHTLFAQVTPFQVHVKMGHFNTIAWVTDMATGQPVSDAKVMIYKDKIQDLKEARAALSQSMTSKDGVAILGGIETLDPHLQTYRSRFDAKKPHLFVRVDKNGEMALLPLVDSFEVNLYHLLSSEDMVSDIKPRYSHIQAWGTTAQAIYHAGDTIQYKLYVRNQNNKTLIPAPRSGYRLSILDPTGKEVYSQENITLGKFGDYQGEVATSPQSTMGWYKFKLTADFSTSQERQKKGKKSLQKEGEGGQDDEEEESDSRLSDNYTWTPIYVLLSDFKPSPFKVTHTINGNMFHDGQRVEVLTQATLHSGGPQTDSPVRITAILEKKPFTSEHYAANGFDFSEYNPKSDPENETREEDKTEIFQKADQLDSKGEKALSFTLPPSSIHYGLLTFESAVQDDQGRNNAAQTSANYAGVDRFIGLKTNEWMFQTGKPAKIDYLVVDENGNPVAGTKVDFDVEKQDVDVAKVKSAGSAYLAERTKKWVFESACHETSEARTQSCMFTPKEPGFYRAIATVQDLKGREYKTKLHFYVVGKGYVLWDTPNEFALEIIPEKKTYQVGEKARYFIKNPFPGAQALVSIERYGVLDHFVQTLEGSSPVIEFEVKEDYIPGFYLSVVVFSPRVDKPIEGKVDLGKPTFRLGYVTVPVVDRAKEMLVTLKTDRDIYKPRDKVKVKLHAEPRLKNIKEPIQFAVTVLDEGVLDLLIGGKSYFDPYKGFFGLDNLDLINYSLLERLVGRQKFEKKGANPGGDGGADLAMRHMFKFVSYWNPSIEADANGDAEIEFEVPDNLTSWRALAIAMNPSDRMGLGDTHFKVNRSVEIRPAMPNQVLEGDQFQANFTITNRTDRKQDIAVHIEATGDIDKQKSPDSLEKLLSLEPYKRALVSIPIQTKNIALDKNIEEGSIQFKVRAKDSEDGDMLEHKLNVKKRRSFINIANYGTIDTPQLEQSIQFPDNIHLDSGRLDVFLSSSLISNMEGVFNYIKTYPYSCWEQKITMALLAARYGQMKSYLSKEFNWEEAKNLPADILSLAGNFQAPSGGMAYFKPEDAYVDPYLSAYTAWAFHILRKDGYKIPEEVEKSLHNYLMHLLKRDSYPDFYDKNAFLDVRLMALAALAKSGKIHLADLARFQPQLSQMSLMGKNYFIQASRYIKGAEHYTSEALDMLLSQENQMGSATLFEEKKGTYHAEVLSSQLRENCSLLSTLTALGERKEYANYVKEIPQQLMQAVLRARGNRTHWNNTQEDVFCVNAIVDYAKIYEKTPPNMHVSARLDQLKLGEAHLTDVKDPPAHFTKDIEKQEMGRVSKILIERSGNGRLYAQTRLTYAPLEEKKEYSLSGMEIHREYSVKRDKVWELLQSSLHIQSSDLVRVDIFLLVPTARNFVVVADPVPSGLEPVMRDLATTSRIDADQNGIASNSWRHKYDDWVGYGAFASGFYHKDLRYDSVRFYADYLPAGHYHLSYVAQAIVPGSFKIMPIVAEEMYNPDVYAKGIVEELQIKGRPE